MPGQIHSKFTCDELETLLTSAAELWIGIRDLDDITDAASPELVDLWEKAAREYIRLMKEEDERTVDVPGAPRPPR